MLATWPGTLTLVIALSTQSGTTPEGLPDTPQGRHVSGYIEAFNAGEKAFVAMYGVVTIPEMAAATPPARRVELYKQLVREVGTIKVEKVIASSPKSITLSMRAPTDKRNKQALESRAGFFDVA